MFKQLVKLLLKLWLTLVVTNLSLLLILLVVFNVNIFYYLLLVDVNTVMWVIFYTGKCFKLIKEGF